MRMKRIKWLALHLSSILLVFGICSCEDKEDTPVYDITGEWIDAHSDLSQTSITTIEFTKEGKFNKWTAHVSKESHSTIKDVGTFTNNGKVDIVYSIKNLDQYYPRRLHEVWRIIDIGKYKLHIYDEKNGIEQTYHKVAETIDMGVDAFRTIKINDDDIHVIEYKSCDERIARVNDNGVINAVKRGTTYIRIISSEGELAVKVTVSDNNNIIDDYAKYIGEPVSYGNNDLGDLYTNNPQQDGSTTIEYNIIDDVIKRVYINYFDEYRVWSIKGVFLDDTNVAKIINSFDKKYEKRDSESPHLHKYLSLLAEHGIEIIINDEKRTVDYKLLPNDFELFDGLITKNIDEVIMWLSNHFGQKLAIDNSGFSKFERTNYNYIESFSFSYDVATRDIMSVNLQCDKGVNSFIVNRWYNEHYTLQNDEDGIYYTHGKNVLLEDYYIEIKNKYGNIEIGYFNRKTMSR